MALVEVTHNADGSSIFRLHDAPEATFAALFEAQRLGVPIGFEGYGIQGRVVNIEIVRHSIDMTTYGSTQKQYLACGHDIIVHLK